MAREGHTPPRQRRATLTLPLPLALLACALCFILGTSIGRGTVKQSRHHQAERRLALPAISSLGPRRTTEVSQAEEGDSALQHSAYGEPSSSSPQYLHNYTLLSQRPRIILFHDLITEREAEYLVNLAKPTLSRSAVVGAAEHWSRTSSGTFLPRGPRMSPAEAAERSRSYFRDMELDDTDRQASGGTTKTTGHRQRATSGSRALHALPLIEQKIANATQIPIESGEPLYVLQYESGQKYEPHYDFFNSNPKKPKVNNDRVATLLIYLRTPDKGGETVFPYSHAGGMEIEYGTSLQRDIERHRYFCRETNPYHPFKLTAPVGSAILFYDYELPSLTAPDMLSLHGGCPVLGGTKWVATRWMRRSKYRGR